MWVIYSVNGDVPPMNRKKSLDMGPIFSYFSLKYLSTGSVLQIILRFPENFDFCFCFCFVVVVVVFVFCVWKIPLMGT